MTTARKGTGNREQGTGTQLPSSPPTIPYNLFPITYSRRGTETNVPSAPTFSRPRTVPCSLFPVPSQRGFTLLEVLVATAIMGTAVAALFGLLSGALGNMQRMRGPSQALLLGQSLMNELFDGRLWKHVSILLPISRRGRPSWSELYWTFIGRPRLVSKRRSCLLKQFNYNRNL